MLCAIHQRIKPFPIINVISGPTTLGTVGVTSVGSNINLTYTPIISVDIEVRTFGIALKIFDANTHLMKLTTKML